VLSRPELDGEAGWRRVVETFNFEAKEIWEIALATTSGVKEVLRATGNHPFWAEGVGWTGAEYLERGQTLRLSDGSAASVVYVENTRATAPVFNFEVDGWHTYHVGELGVWVHNADCFGDILIADGIDAPVDMFRAHGHHILFKKGIGPRQQALVNEGQAILRHVGINPIRGVENLTWASNVKGIHTGQHLRSVVDDLRGLGANPLYDDVVDVLGKHGAAARARSVYRMD
jgi:Pretoxin HINT domain